MQLCHSLNELNKVPSPKVVLASFPDMETGFARELFLQWCSNANNSIILTSRYRFVDSKTKTYLKQISIFRTSPGTLARDLIDNGGARTIDLTVERRVKLEGLELEDYEKRQKELVIEKHMKDE